MQTTSPSSSTAPVGAAALMAAEMEQVDAVIRRRLASDVALIDQIAHYIISAGGKRIRPIAVTSKARVSALPDVPPIADYPPLKDYELVNFFGFLGPAGMPDPVLRKLNEHAVQALKNPDMATKLRNVGFEPAPTTPDEFRDFIRSELKKFGQVIVAAGVKPAQ